LFERQRLLSWRLRPPSLNPHQPTSTHLHRHTPNRGAADADLSTLAVLTNLAVAVFPDFNLGWLYKELRHKLEEELGGSCVG